MVELRYNRSCSVRILWKKLCQDILSVVVPDITAMVESRAMVNHKYYRRGSVMILQKMLSSYHSISNISIIALKVSGYTRSGRVRVLYMW